ncbi:penicillin-binding protein [Synergistales bacterium]|nr:penicillin-binding protein [Synergistales bacterium]
MEKIFRWTLLIVVFVIFASGAVAVYTVFFRRAPDDVQMPLMRERPILEVMNDAKRLGLTVKIEQVASSLPPGRVLAQSPEAGVRLSKNKTVVLQVSRGGARRAVPDVRNLNIARAQSVIREQGFEVGDVIYIKDEGYAGGLVIAQNPAAPANVPSNKKVDLLVNNSGAGASGNIIVPDVAQMSEREAKELLASSGFKVPAVDYVYSPNATEGQVIGTRPVAGAQVRAGDGIRLKIATSKRPDGVSEVAVAPAPPAQTPAVTQTPRPTTAQVRVDMPGREPIVIQNPTLQNPTQAPAPQPAPTPAPQTAPLPPQTPQAPPPAPQQTANLTPIPGKIARVRYGVPPLTRPLSLKIELADPTGTKVLLDRNARSGEYISLDAQYSRECVITIYLGGEFVWQDRYM